MMLSRTEIERLASMAHELRPDWPVASLVTWLGADHSHRAYRDAAVALAYVATDSETRTPKRMNETGPWWGVGPAAAGVTDVRFERCQEPGHSSFPAWNCSACRAEEIARTYRPEPPSPDEVRIAEQQAVTAKTGAAIVRAAMREHGIPKGGAE